MKNSMKKAGISMVALVITIIVLIVLTSAVVITGVGAPKQAQLAVFKSNVATIQDAITTQMGNNMLTGALEGKDNDYKWLGIVEGYNGTGNIDFANGEIIVGESVLPLSTELRSIVKISEEELANYYVSEEGTVYHRGFESNGITYYNNNVAGGTYTMTELWQNPSKGTQGVTITISTAEELNDLARYTNAENSTKGVTFKLMNDITLNENVLNADGTLNETNSASFEQWTPIGKPLRIFNPEDETVAIEVEPVKFKGVFDGQGYNISGLYINTGVEFGQALIADNEGVVKNVSIVDSYIHAEGQYTSSVVGYNYGIVDSCSNSATISNGDYWNHLGGIVGLNEGIVKNSYNVGALCGNISHIGGISPLNYGKIINCYNKGTISGTNAVYVGGIVGRNYGTIMNCYNEGVVSVNNVTLRTTLIGGISGNGSGKIINCYNKGTIGGTNVSYVAGIMGVCGINRTNEPLQLSNVYNLGNITGQQYVGGISGSGYQANQSTISNIYDTNETYFGKEMPNNYVIENEGPINADGTFPNDTPYADLLTALNAWVDANKSTYPELKNWEMGDNDFPTFM